MALQSYYKMNTGWADSSGNGYDGTNNGATIDTVNQKLGAGCGSYDGLNDFQSYTNHFDINNATKLSIDGWVKSTAGAIDKGIFGWWTGSNGFFIQSITTGLSGGDGLLIVAGSSFGYIKIDVSTAFAYFAGVYDGTLTGDANRLKLYVNNVQQALTFIGAIPASITGLSGAKPETGKIPGLARYWDGLIDDLAFYDHDLTQAYINDRWNGGVGHELPLAALGGFPFFFDAGHK